MQSQPLITVIQYINKILKKSSNKSFSKVNKKVLICIKKLVTHLTAFFP